MRVLHILDHSLPLHSGYAFRTAAILRDTRMLGWATLQLTTPRHGATVRDVEDIEGWWFHRTPSTGGVFSSVASAVYVREMVATARRIDELVSAHSPDILHAHSPALNALPALWVGMKR